MTQKLVFGIVGGDDLVKEMISFIIWSFHVLETKVTQGSLASKNILETNGSPCTYIIQGLNDLVTDVLDCSHNQSTDWAYFNKVTEDYSGGG